MSYQSPNVHKPLVFKSLPLTNQVWPVLLVGDTEGGITPTLLVLPPKPRGLLMLPLVPSPELFLEVVVSCPLLCLQVLSAGVKRGPQTSVAWHCGQTSPLLH